LLHPSSTSPISRDTMKLRLGAFLLCLLLSSIAFSQPGTGDKICFTPPVAKAIAVDLVRGDSAKAELEATQTLLIQTEAKCALLDSSNQVYQHKNSTFLKQIGTFEEKDKVKEIIIADLTSDNKKLRFQLKVGTITVGAVLVAALLIK